MIIKIRTLVLRDQHVIIIFLFNSLTKLHKCKRFYFFYHFKQIQSKLGIKVEWRKIIENLVSDKFPLASCWLVSFVWVIWVFLLSFDIIYIHKHFQFVCCDIDKKEEKKRKTFMLLTSLRQKIKNEFCLKSKNRTNNFYGHRK